MHVKYDSRFMNIVFTGGGTLGSVTPLLAIHEQLQPSKAFWIGTRHGVEKELVDRAAIPFYAIHAGKFRRYIDVRNFFAPFETIVGFFEVLLLLRKLRPTHIFGAGGYVQVPVIFAAWFLRIPSYAIQLDVRPGLANRCVAPFVRKVFVVFPESARFFSKGKSAMTGSFVRNAFHAHVSQPKERRPALLVLGGSTGARSLNVMVWDAASELVTMCDVVHVTGKGKGRALVLPHYISHDVVTDALPALIARAAIVISRAGMGALSELAAMRKAAIVVPLPDTHQEENAAVLAKHDAAIVLRQKELTPEKLVDIVRKLLNDTEQRRVLGFILSEVIPTSGALEMKKYIL